MSDVEADDLRCTPTDPSLEFDLFEVVRLRLAPSGRRGLWSIDLRGDAIGILCSP